MGGDGAGREAAAGSGAGSDPTSTTEATEPELDGVGSSEVAEAVRENGRLRTLSLAGCHWSAVEGLKGLPVGVALEELDLRWVQGCTDATFATLASEWTALRQTQTLLLSSCDVGDATVRLIANAFTRLAALDLSYCAKVSDLSIQALAAAGSPSDPTSPPSPSPLAHYSRPPSFPTSWPSRDSAAWTFEPPRFPKLAATNSVRLVALSAASSQSSPLPTEPSLQRIPPLSSLVILAISRQSYAPPICFEYSFAGSKHYIFVLSFFCPCRAVF